MRLRTLSEAECYARCYGGRGEERVSFVKTVRVHRAHDPERTARLRELAETLFGEEGREAA